MKSIQITTLVAVALACQSADAMQNALSKTSFGTMTYLTPKNAGITAALGVLGAGIYYAIKLSKLRKIERALQDAAKIGDLAGINNALTAGANINAFGLEPEDTALKLAVAHQQIPAIQALLNKGARVRFDPIDLRDCILQTVLNTKNDDIIKIFVKHNKNTQEYLLYLAQNDSALTAKVQAAINT